MGTESELGPVVFTDPQQIRLMEAIKQRYQRAFANAPNIESAHQRIPELLNINRQEQDPYFSWMSMKQFGHLPKKLTVEQLDVDYYREETAPYSSSINGNVTDDLIASGMRYIEQIESAFLERKTCHPFVNIHRPDYYLILMISERVKTLCKTSMTAALMSEYACLEKFMNALTEIVNDYFPASCFQQRQAFHAYLEGGVTLLQTMQKRAHFELDRSAISEQIYRLKCHVENYHGKLALFLAYCMTDTELSNALSLGQLQTGDSLPASFAKSPLYREMHQRLQPNVLPTLNAGISENTVGLSAVLRERCKVYPEAMRNAFRSHDQLLMLLSTSFALATCLASLSQHAQWKGEYEVVHDKTLSFLLKTYLKLIHGFVVACQQHMDTIREQNTAALTGREKITGAAKNGKRAARIAKNLNRISEQMQESCDTVKEKIKKIKKENAKTLAVQQNGLLLDTKELLTRITKNGILVGSVELLATLQRRCKADTERMPSTAGSLRLNHVLAKNNPEKVTPVNCIVRKKNVASSSLPPIEKIFKKAAVSISEPPRRRPVIIRQSPVAAIHRVLEQHPEVKACFDAKVAELYDETDHVFPELLEKVQRIYTLHLQLSKELNALKQVEKIVDKSLFNETIRILNALKECITNTTYAGNSFEKFSFIKNLPHFHREEKTKHLREINRILTPYYPSPSETDNPFYTPTMVAYRPVREEAGAKSEPTLGGFRELLAKIKETNFSLNENVIDYYESAIQREKWRLSTGDSTSQTDEKDRVETRSADSLIPPQTTSDHLELQEKSPQLSLETITAQKSRPPIDAFCLSPTDGSQLSHPAVNNEEIISQLGVTQTASQAIEYGITATNSVTTPSTQPLFRTQETTAYTHSLNLIESVTNENTTPMSTINNAHIARPTQSSESFNPLMERLNCFHSTIQQNSSSPATKENVTTTTDPSLEIQRICQKLRNSNDDNQLQSELLNFYTQLSQYHYQVSTYFFGLLGGKTFYSGGSKKLMTTTAFKMLSYYEDNIRDNDKFSSLTLAEKKVLINDLLTIPKESAERFFSLTYRGFCLFQPRHHSVQELYKAMADISPTASASMRSDSSF